MIEHDDVRVFLGPPGTGKTSKMLSIMEAELDAGTPPNKIAFITFTKKGATEALQRATDPEGRLARLRLKPGDLPWFRTIHSLVFRQMGYRKNQVVGHEAFDELGKRLGVVFTGGVYSEEGMVSGLGTGDRLVFLENLARVTNKGLRKIWEESDHGMDWSELDVFSRSYRMFKRSRNLVDYTDMLEEFVGAMFAPAVDVLIVDEAQDLSWLQWEVVAALARGCRVVYVAGDDDQCSIDGTMVSTTEGEIPIEKLNPCRHRLVSYSMEDGRLVGWQKGYRFDIQRKKYKGRVVDLSAAGRTTSVTPNHRCIVRWGEKRQSTNCVYLMQQGTRFRVGWCQMFRSDGSFHLNVRARIEKADRAWVLATFEDKTSASVYESVVAARFGLPTVTFEPVSGASHLTSEAIASVFSQLGDLTTKAASCLHAHGRLPDYGLYDKNKVQRFGSLTFETAAANVIPELMLLPVVNMRNIEWRESSVSSRLVETTIHALDVEKHHTYVADSIATHNSIYRWAGADVEQFIDIAERYPSSVLEQSHRVPAAVHPLATSLVNRIHHRKAKTFRPRDVDGSLRWVSDLEELNLREGKWLLLARNSYMLKQLEEHCLWAEVNFDSPGRRWQKSSLLRAIMTWERLRKGEHLPVDDVADVARFFKSRRWSAGLRQMDPGELLSMENLKDRGLRTAAIWHEAMDLFPEGDKEYFIKLRSRGEKLLGPARIKISTIHGVKGGEADNVLLLTDISLAAYNSMIENADDETRCFYVGLTRSRENLFLMQPQTNLHYAI